MFMNIFFNSECIFHSSQGKHPLQSDTGNCWLRRSGSRRQEQFVIFLLELFSVFQIFYGNSFFIRMDGGNLVPNFHCNLKSGEEAFGCLKGQSIGIINYISDIVGQTAVGIGNIS